MCYYAWRKQMDKCDIGKLKRLMEVTAKGDLGIIVSVDEPKWRDHKTQANMHELQGATVKVNCIDSYFHAKDITILIR
jgi:hypothetical protein